jgi:predicted kinase
MKEAIVSIGISASGKSTDAMQWCAVDPINRVEVNRDNIRKRLVESDGEVFSWDTWDWKREKEVTIIAWEKIRECANQKKSVYISDTNLNTNRRNSMIKELESLGFTVIVKVFYVSLEEAWRRDAARKNGVGHSVIAKQYKEFLETIGRKRYTADETKPKCILVDIDGTLAHMNGKRGAFEWDKVDLDIVDHCVRELVNGWKKVNSAGKIIILSGRDGSCYNKTSKWLMDNDVMHDCLIMREQNDIRKDTVVKEEIFWRDIAPNYNVHFVIDDRPSVIRMWQELGVKTFIVGNPWIEF